MRKTTQIQIGSKSYEILLKEDFTEFQTALSSATKSDFKSQLFYCFEGETICLEAEDDYDIYKELAKSQPINLFYISPLIFELRAILEEINSQMAKTFAKEELERQSPLQIKRSSTHDPSSSVQEPLLPKPSLDSLKYAVVKDKISLKIDSLSASILIQNPDIKDQQVSFSTIEKFELSANSMVDHVFFKTLCSPVITVLNSLIRGAIEPPPSSNEILLDPSQFVPEDNVKVSSFSKIQWEKLPPVGFNTLIEDCPFEHFDEEGTPLKPKPKKVKFSISDLRFEQGPIGFYISFTLKNNDIFWPYFGTISLESTQALVKGRLTRKIPKNFGSEGLAKVVFEIANDDFMPNALENLTKNESHNATPIVLNLMIEGYNERGTMFFYTKHPQAFSLDLESCLVMKREISNSQ